MSYGNCSSHKAMRMDGRVAPVRDDTASRGWVTERTLAPLPSQREAVKELALMLRGRPLTWALYRRWVRWQHNQGTTNVAPWESLRAIASWSNYDRLTLPVELWPSI